MPSSDFIPDYLKPFVATQDASLYTPMDHAAWRFILRVSKDYFGQNAHPKYLAGLEETGISSERIPLVSEMDAKLQKFGWRAVPVSGFIPPAVFMEFQSLGILPIACEMRTNEHLAYTPAPDIVHEAAGHAPIIADPEYAAYLRNYGEISRKAIFSSQDMDVYEAVRNLSIVKEDPRSTAAEIAAAEKRLDTTVEAVSYASEASLMARMNWWTVEYGLVGSLENPKIYGAGLLSSIGESYHCLGANVRRLPLSIDCIETSYDITKPQPQLFVARDFTHLTSVLGEFAETMAFRTGGKSALDKAVAAKTVCTVELESGVQFSGVVESYLELGAVADAHREIGGKIAYVKLSGPTALAYRDQELPGQGTAHHREGFSTVLGLVKGPRKSPAELSEAELAGLRDSDGITRFEFTSGISLAGKLRDATRRDGRNLILSFEDCTVTHENDTLFKPEWGVFDLACGSRVVSVFGGPADRKAYLESTGGFRQSPMAPKNNLTEENRVLNTLYAAIRALREENVAGEKLEAEIRRIEAELEKDFPTDWLSRLELLELISLCGISVPEAKSRIERRMREIRKLSKDRAEMIDRGLATL